MKNVLIFPAGTEVAFEIFNALKYSKFVRLIGGTSVPCHAEFIFENCIEGFPFIDDEMFIPFLNKIIDEYQIEYIYPAHDSVQMKLTELQEQIHARVVTSPLKTVEICRSKAKTYEFFAKEDFLPRCYKDIEDIDSYPVFVKPAVGQGSVGAQRIDTKERLALIIKEIPDLVLCEYLPGMEYTVDCFTDRKGNLRIAKLRNRERIRAGIAVRSKSLEIDEEINSIANRINDALTFNGAWFFQVKKNNSGNYRLMEVSPRIPGTMGLSRNMGINFPMLTLYNMWESDVDIIDNEYSIMLDRAFINRYQIDIFYDKVYVDFDDTMIINGKVNVSIMTFIYQAINQGKKIYLLTKHAGNIYEDLEKYRISKSLFDEIIHIPQNCCKSVFIQKKDAIFIDDSFAERNDVKKKLGIPVFDIDMVESLLDCRR